MNLPAVAPRGAPALHATSDSLVLREKLFANEGDAPFTGLVRRSMRERRERHNLVLVGVGAVADAPFTGTWLWLCSARQASTTSMEPSSLTVGNVTQ